MSGGVDSSVVAALIKKAIGNKMIAVLIDHGLMRKDEAKECENFLKEGLNIKINVYDESNIFFAKLKGLQDPEKKEKQLDLSLLNHLIEFQVSSVIYPF